jgi:protein-L-isoaspartate(D-aspartate) O-methyltransferase
MQDFEHLRKEMVEYQIRLRGIKSGAVLRAMEKVPRHRFVSGGEIGNAYSDGPLPIGEGQTISQPYIVALMTEALGIDGQSRVLEIGTGSGYQTAVLAEIAREVYTVERIESLSVRARGILTDLGFTNIYYKVGNGFEGWSEHSPFDGIIVTCAPEKIPPALIGQLAENGRLVIPVGARNFQRLEVIKKIEGKIGREEICAVRFVPMVED